MKRFTYKPKENLTIQELSEVFTVTLVALIEGITGQPQTGSDLLELEEHLYNSFPDNVKRHFTKSESD